MRLGERDPLTSWPEFSARARARLEAGRAAYGERSFSADPAALLGELQQEALDLAGWGFILFVRLERACQALAAATAQPDTPQASGASRPTESRDQVLARRGAVKAERAASVGAVRDALVKLQPDIGARQLEGLVGAVIAVQRGTAEPPIRAGVRHERRAQARPGQSSGSRRASSKTSGACCWPRPSRRNPRST